MTAFGDQPPRVAILVETARGYGRQLLRGVIHYVRLHGPWSIYITPGDLEQVLPRMKRWGGTGVLARVESARAARAIAAAGLPSVILGPSQRHLLRNRTLARFSNIVSDSEGAAVLAAEHLRERGFRNFAFVGGPERLWSHRRQDAFCRRLAEEGLSVRVYRASDPAVGRTWHRGRPRHWESEHRELTRWLRELPRPCGVMACNDDRGREVLEACRLAGIRVPEELAVVGVDNDELWCELSDPPLSSVALDAEGAGYRAAALLDRMMRGEKCERQTITALALRVVTRRSTDVVAVEDPDVAAALHFIHNRAAEPIDVGDVVAAVCVSRRALELRFRRLLGRTIHEELDRVRMRRAEQLLRETDLAVPQVAKAVGYSSAGYLARLFRKRHGLTPAQYRRDSRVAAAAARPAPELPA
ncbi:MAG: substrate-binding domain-containing protein [Thermogutta sp.]